MDRNEVRAIVIELLQELLAGTVKNVPVLTRDGDEWNHLVFDATEFVGRVFSRDNDADCGEDGKKGVNDE